MSARVTADLRRLLAERRIVGYRLRPSAHLALTVAGDDDEQVVTATELRTAALEVAGEVQAAVSMCDLATDDGDARCEPMRDDLEDDLRAALDDRPPGPIVIGGDHAAAYAAAPEPEPNADDHPSRRTVPPGWRETAWMVLDAAGYHGAAAASVADGPLLRVEPSAHVDRMLLIVPTSGPPRRCTPEVAREAALIVARSGGDHAGADARLLQDGAWMLAGPRLAAVRDEAAS